MKMSSSQQRRIEAVQRSAVDGGRVMSLSARSSMPVARTADSPLARYISAESRLHRDGFSR